LLFEHNFIEKLNSDENKSEAFDAVDNCCFILAINRFSCLSNKGQQGALYSLNLFQ